MADMNTKDLVKLMLDYRHGCVKQFSKDEARETIRQALIDANGGSTKLTYKSFRNNPQMYTIIETLIDQVRAEGLTGNEFFNRFVEQKNLAEGDGAEFTVKEKANLVVADIARGTQGIRRQRVAARSSVTLVPTAHGIKAYEEMTRVLSGRADINDLVDQVTEAVTKRQLDDIYGAFSGVTQDTLGEDYYPTAGTYDEDALLDVCQRVSAINDGATVTIVCTLKGARKIKATTNVSNEEKSDIYNYGYPMKWNGIDVIVVPQRLKAGSDEFIFDDDKIYVIPSNMDRFIKMVVGGDDVFKITDDATENADMSMEVMYITYYVVGVVVGRKFGVYEMT